MVVMFWHMSLQQLSVGGERQAEELNFTSTEYIYISLSISDSSAEFHCIRNKHVSFTDAVVFHKNVRILHIKLKLGVVVAEHCHQHVI